MKKFTIIIGLMLLNSLCFAQSIEVDRYRNNGKRQIKTDNISLTLSGKDYQFFVDLFIESSGDSLWYIGISSTEAEIPEDAILLIKFADASLIEPTFNNRTVSKVGTTMVGGYVNGLPGPDVDQYIALFHLSPYQLKVLKEKEITKIRISTPLGYNEKTFILNRLGSYLSSSIEAIERRMRKPLSTIYDGF